MGMVVRTNTMAINANRQLTNNSNAVAKSLEKLSSGYRINRAGDDASGLAISEKMKAQIKGLEQASNNSQDGISLIQTAEGALTEVHSMLNRMVELATKSANGTIQNDVDRENIQNEVDALTDEINRIGDSTNFNGISLLNGSLSGSGAAAGVPNITGLDLTPHAATKSSGDVTLHDLTANPADGKLNYEFKANINGQVSTVKVTLTIDGNALKDENGKEVGSIADTTNHRPTAEEQGKALAVALKNTDIGKNFKVTATATGMTLESTTAGSKGATILTSTAPVAAGTDGTATAVISTVGADAYQSINFFDANRYSPGDIFTVGGKKFAFVETQDQAVAMDKDVHAIVITAHTGQPVEIDVANMANLIERETGYKPEIDVTTTQLNFKPIAGATGDFGGLTLQIGDTSAEYNKMTVSVNDMRAEALGVGNVDVSTQDAAGGQIDTIRTAINTVSKQRGDLGALQNRLEHTINNLDTTSENMTAANSRIRDTDMAKEMMNYTKMNVLVQSAQAMLAQANQQPQSILQLLQ